LPESSKKTVQLHYGSQKVRDYKSEDLKELFKFILSLCKFIGVTEPPEKDVIILLIDHIQEHHSDFSKEEIYRAFSMATAGKLNFDFQHFNRITPQLFSNTLNRYKQYRSKNVLDYLKRVKELEDKKNDQSPSPKKILEDKIKYAQEYFDSYVNQISKPLKEREYPYDMGSVTYNFLVYLGLINLNAEEKQELIEESSKVVAEKLLKKKRAYKVSKVVSDVASFEMQSTFKTLALRNYCSKLYSRNFKMIDVVVNRLIDLNDTTYKLILEENNNVGSGNITR
jgi:hypothetical protein